MVKLRALPLGRRVACLAGGREPGRSMVRICHCIVSRLVARHTVLRRSGKAVIGMALRAGDACVFPRQGELRCRIVVEPRACPLHGRVAAGAG